MKKIRVLAMLILIAVGINGIPESSLAVSQNSYGKNAANVWNWGGYYSKGCCTGGNTFYYNIYNKLYKMNLKTGKKQLVYTYKDAFSINSIQYYKKRLYIVIDKYMGTGGSYPYITRLNENGTGMKMLDVGDSVTIEGGKIYYIKQTELDDFETFDPVGVYSMKPDGSSKKCLIKNDIVTDVVCDGKVITYRDLYGTFRTNLKGKNKKQIGTVEQNVVGIYKNVFYYLENAGEQGDNLFQKNLTTNKVTKLESNVDSSLAKLDSLTGKLYFGKFVSSGVKDTIYQRDLKTGTKKVVLSMKNIYSISLFGNYITYAQGQSDYNTISRIMKFSTKKKIRMGKYFVS